MFGRGGLFRRLSNAAIETGNEKSLDSLFQHIQTEPDVIHCDAAPRPRNGGRLEAGAAARGPGTAF